MTSHGAFAQTAIGASGATIDFTGFTGAGFSASPTTGQLSSQIFAITGFSDGDLNFGGNATAPDYTRGLSTGGIDTGGIYAFNNGGNVFLGVQPVLDDFTPGTITVRFQNSLTHRLISLGVSYRILVRNDAPRSNSLNFSWAVDNGAYTNVAGLDFVSPAAADTTPAWVSTTKTTTLTTDIAPNGLLLLRFTGDDATGTGNRDEMGIDDIVITVNNACGDGVAQGAEECDDGNTSNTDNCLNNCKQATCGDGYVRTGEQCDPGAAQCCTQACTLSTGNACNNGNGTCDNGVCMIDTSAGGAAGEAGMGGVGGEAGNAGQAGAGTGGTLGGMGGRGGRGGRGSGGAPAAGTAGTAGTAGGEITAGTAGTTATGGAPAGGSPGAGNGGTPGAGTANGGGAGVQATGGKSGAGGSSGTTSSGGKSGGAGAGGKRASSTPADTKDDSGCGCEVPGRSSNSGLALSLGAALAALVSLRRRRLV